MSIVLFILIYGLALFARETHCFFNQEINLKSPWLQKYSTSLVPLIISILVIIIFPEYQKILVFFYVSF